MYIFVYMYLNIYHVSACNAGDTGDASLIHGSGRSPEEGMATDSNILAWEILWTQGAWWVIQFMGSQRVRQDSTSTGSIDYAYMCVRACI